MKKLTLFLVCLMVGGMANAAPEKYQFDKVHSQVLFFVNHLGFSNSKGQFNEYDGELLFDTDNLANSKIDVTIDTASIAMGSEPWDKHMRNEDFFDVEKYPTMSFRSKRIVLTGADTMIVNGDLTILGVTKPAGLYVTFNKAGEHPFSKKQIAGFSAIAKIKRSDWGMTYGLPAIGDEVEIRLEVEAAKVE